MDNDKSEPLNNIYSEPDSALSPEVPASETVEDVIPRIEITVSRRMTDVDVNAQHNKLCETVDTFTFKAGRVDVEYEEKARFACSRPTGENAVIEGKFTPYNFDKYGLKCTCKEGVISISGKPTQKYDGVIKIVLNASYEVRQTETPAGKNGARTAKRYGCTKTYQFDKFVAERQFVINPDPWSLWEEHEPSDALPYPKPHVAHESGIIPCEEGATPLTVLAASRRGRSHAHAATFRDDDFAMKLGENVGDWNFIVVADGAGSAKYSRKGSRIACETAVNMMNSIFTSPEHGAPLLENLKAQVAQKSREGNLFNDANLNPEKAGIVKLFYNVPYYVYSNINNEAEARKKADDPDAKIKDYSTTLLCAAIKRLEKTDDTPALWLIVSYWVGDGGIVVDRPNAESHALALTEPDSGEFAGQTRFITMRDQIVPEEVTKRVRVSVVKNFKALTLMTDGITDPFFPAEEDITHYDLWERFWRDEFPRHFPGVLDDSKSLEERAKALEDDLNFKVKGNHDDRTFVLVLGKDEKIEDNPATATAEESATTTEVKPEHPAVTTETATEAPAASSETAQKQPLNRKRQKSSSSRLRPRKPMPRIRRPPRRKRLRANSSRPRLRKSTSAIRRSKPRQTTQATTNFRHRLMR